MRNATSLTQIQKQQAPFNAPSLHRSVHFNNGVLSPICGNYFETETRDEYWISGPKKNGQDRHWAGGGPVAIDDDVIEEYWQTIRGCPPPKSSSVAQLLKEMLFGNAT